MTALGTVTAECKADEDGTAEDVIDTGADATVEIRQNGNTVHAIEQRVKRQKSARIWRR